MIGIRFHGRGGQGAVVASKILAQAYFKSGYFVQAFPSFGMERKGAAVTAYVRLDADKIMERGEIHDPDAVIVLDPTLLQMIDVTSGLKPGGLILLNYPDDSPAPPLGTEFRTAAVDAGRIASDFGLGSRMSPIVNTTILGAFARAAQDLEISILVEAVRRGVPVKSEENAEATLAAYNSFRWMNGEHNAA